MPITLNSANITSNKLNSSDITLETLNGATVYELVTQDYIVTASSIIINTGVFFEGSPGVALFATTDIYTNASFTVKKVNLSSNEEIIIPLEYIGLEFQYYDTEQSTYIYSSPEEFYYRSRYKNGGSWSSWSSITTTTSGIYIDTGVGEEFQIEIVPLRPGRVFDGLNTNLFPNAWFYLHLELGEAYYL